jgi:hypothetical protein
MFGKKINGFDRIEPFDQKEIIDDFKIRLLLNPRFAKRELPFLKGNPTIESVYDGNIEGWCFGICADVIARLENPMITMQKQLIRVESCRQAFKSAMKQVESKPVEALLLQEMQARVPQIPNVELYSSPPDMNSHFSMWFLQASGNPQRKGWVHAIITSNNKELGSYFIFDPNGGFYESSKKFTQYLNNKLQQAISQGMNHTKAMKEIIQEAALTFAEGVEPYGKWLLSFIKNTPYVGSKKLSNIVERFKADMNKYLPK